MPADIVEPSSSLSTLTPRKTGSLLIAVLVALAMHTLLILGVSFDLPRYSPPAPERILDITLLSRPLPEPVEQPDFLAQASQQGGGEQIEKQRTESLPSTPPAVPSIATPPTTQPKPITQPATVTTPSTAAKPPLLTQQDSPRVEPVHSEPKPPPQFKPRLSQIYASTQLEIDRLTAELDKRTQAAAQRDRRKTINASTQEYKYAAYLEAWRKKVERIGNLNYPDDAKRKRLYGTLLLHVSVRADGDVEQIRVIKSSGHQLLDDAAQRIVKLAAPFAPFPPDIRQEVDVLDIVRTWQFRNGNRLFAN